MTAYLWRDPKRLSADKRAALEARDRPEAPDPKPKRPPSQAACVRFAELREQGLTITNAAAEVGIGKHTAARWEKLRRAGELLP